MATEHGPVEGDGDRVPAPGGDIDAAPGLRGASAAEFRTLLATLGEVADRYAGEEWSIVTPDDTAEALRSIVHQLGTAIESQFEDDPARPVFRELVTPWRKALGDNSDARYHDAPVDQRGRYVLTGATAGAVYVSVTAEAGPGGGAFPVRTAAAANDTTFDVDPTGRFRLEVGEGATGRNSLDLPVGSNRITVRHYFEEAVPCWLPPRDLALSLELVGGEVPPGPRRPDDASVAAAIGRVATYVRARTVDLIAKPGEGDPPGFVSRVPHLFPPPVPPGDHPLAARDAAYSLAPFLLGPEEALVVSLRWPRCRCANVQLWNRHMQTFDYLRHPVGLNRAQTVDDPDGGVTLVVSHSDPGVANWLDTEGSSFGLVFFRFMLPEGPIDTPRARVVPLASLLDGDADLGHVPGE